MAHDFLTGGTDGLGAVLDPTGKFVYAMNRLSGTIAGFTVDATSGALSAIGGSPFAAGRAFIANLVMHPSGQYLYTALQAAFTPGTATPPVPTTALSIGAYSINGSTGVLTPIAGSPLTTFGVVSSTALGALISITPNGKFLYVNADASNDIQGYQIEQTSGALTAVPGMPFSAGSNPGIIFLDPSNKYLYITSRGSSELRSFAINQTSGSLTLISTVNTGQSPGWIAMAGLQ